jgi:hypothetical protein
MNYLKKIGSIIIVIFVTLNSYSQSKPCQIDRAISKYYNDTLYSQIDFCYSNASDSAMVLWIEKNNVDSIPDYEKIRNHFFIKKGDWSLMQLIWDGNVVGFIPGLFDSFFKVIGPKDQFVVSVLYKGEISYNSDILDSICKRIIIVNANDIKGLQIDSSIDMFNYKAKNLIILAEWLE